MVASSKRTTFIYFCLSLAAASEPCKSESGAMTDSCLDDHAVSFLQMGSQKRVTPREFEQPQYLNKGYRQLVDRRHRQLPFPIGLPPLPPLGNLSSLQDSPNASIPGLEGLIPGMGGMGAGLDLGTYKKSKGLATLYTDPGNDMDLVIDITDLLNGSGLVMITALAAQGTYTDQFGTVNSLHAPMEETRTTIFKLVATKDNKSIDVLQPQLSMRTSDSETQKAWEKGVDSPWIGKLERMQTNAGEDRIVIDGVKLIQTGFFVSPSMGAAIQAYHLTRVKSYPTNFDISLTFLSQAGQMAVTFSVIRPPEQPMTSRVFDDRLPYFTQDYTDLGVHTKEFSSDIIDPRRAIDPAVSVIWKYDVSRLPNKTILIHVDPSVPQRWHKAFKKGIEGWNDAFMKAGHSEGTIRGVLPTDSDWPKDYDAGDARFNTISWAIDAEQTFSMGIAKVDPRSGEILKSDIIMGAGWVRAWLNDLHAMKLSATQDLSLGLFQESLQLSTAHKAQHESPHKSLLLQLDADNKGNADADSDKKADADSDKRADADSDSKGKTDTEAEAVHAAMNLLGNFPMSLMAMGLPKESWFDVVEAGLASVVMHETGHILGLRHNFKGSLGVSYECTQNMTCSAEQGLTASIMDYIPMNIPSDGVEKVHLFSPVVGAYDKLAIQYGYMELAPSLEMQNGVPSTPDVLKEVLDKANQFENCVDGERMNGGDPLCAVYDLTSEPLRYYEDQISLLQKLQTKLLDTSVGPGEPYWQYGDIVWSMMTKVFKIQDALSNWVGGMNVSYVHRPYSAFSGVSSSLSERSVRAISASSQRKALRMLLEISRPGKRGLLPSPELLNILPYRSSQDGSISTMNLKLNIRTQQREIVNKLLNTSTLKHVELSKDFGGLGLSTFLDDIVYQVIGTYEGKWLSQTAPEDWDLQMFLVQGLAQKRASDESLPESIEPQMLLASQSTLRAVDAALKRIGKSDAVAAWTKCNSPESNMCMCNGRVRFWNGEDWTSTVTSEGSVECTSETFSIKSDVPDPVCQCLSGPSAKDSLRTHLLELKNHLKKISKDHGLSEKSKKSEESAAALQKPTWSFFPALALLAIAPVWAAA